MQGDASGKRKTDDCGAEATVAPETRASTGRRRANLSATHKHGIMASNVGGSREAFFEAAAEAAGALWEGGAAATVRHWNR